MNSTVCNYHTVEVDRISDLVLMLKLAEISVPCDSGFGRMHVAIVASFDFDQNCILSFTFTFRTIRHTQFHVLAENEKLLLVDLIIAVIF